MSTVTIVNRSHWIYTPELQDGNSSVPRMNWFYCGQQFSCARDAFHGWPQSGDIILVDQNDASEWSLIERIISEVDGLRWSYRPQDHIDVFYSRSGLMRMAFKDSDSSEIVKQFEEFRMSQGEDCE